ncbi:MAG: hypothetical protein V2J24_13305, partial [Pseudomonadales bacterium]|nr:hypothetical protein [Pseudomonadales bacterium]
IERRCATRIAIREAIDNRAQLHLRMLDEHPPAPRIFRRENRTLPEPLLTLTGVAPPGRERIRSIGPHRELRLVFPKDDEP